MAKYLSNRQKNLKVGIVSYTESNTVLEVTGKVGIGTTNATTDLDVNGNIRLRGILYDKDNQPGTSGQILVSTGSGIDWVNGASASAISGITIREEGTIVGTADSVSSINFVGPNVTATASGAAATITIADYVSSSGVATYATSSGISTNLKGGLVGNIPYQSAADTTTFLSNGTSGFILQSNGVGNAPSWVAAAPASAISGITIREEGSVAGTANSVSSINFVGPNVTATASGAAATITIADYVSNSGVSTSVSGGIASVTSLNVSGVSTISVNSSTDALRITQTGDGNAFVVEDSANPDATPFVVRGDGNVGIGTTNPQRRLHLRAQGADGIFLDNTDQTGNSGGPALRVRGQRIDSNTSQSFSGQLILEKWRMDGSINSGQNLGAIIFGGNFATLPGITTGMTYGASIGAMAEGTFSNINTAPTAIVFNTGTVGLGTVTLPNLTYGTEAARITSNRNLLIGATSETGTASQRLQVTGGAYVSGNLGVGITNPAVPLAVNGSSRFFTSGQGDVVISHSSLISSILGATTVQLALGANNTEAIRINTAGNVGIQTTAPQGTLQVGAGTSTFIVTGIGSVGIGVTNPGAKLEVYGTSRFGGTTSTGRRVDITTDGIVTLAYGNNTNQPNLVLQNASDTGSTTNHGNNILWQFGTNTTTTPISAGRINILKEQQWTTTASTQDAYFSIDLAQDGTLGEKVRVTSGGNLGIGTVTPSATLQVKDALAFETTNTTTTSTSQVAVDTFATATFRSAKYQVQVTCPGQISTLGGITTGGRGYTAGTYNVNFTTSSGTGSAAQGTLTVSNGTVGALSIISGGSGYVAGDVLTASGGSGLQVSVGTTDGTGAILTLGSITSAGIGYTAGVGVGTTTLSFLGGTGTSATGLATIFDGVITSSTLLQQPTTGTGGTVYYAGSNYTTSSVLSVDRTALTNTITGINTSVGISTFTSLTAHGLFVNDIIRSSSTSNGLTAGTDYYVVTVPTTTTFTLGTSVGIGTTFTTGTSLSIGFYRNSANAGGQVNYTNAIAGVSTNHQVSDLMVLQNGTTADFVEYATIANNDILGTFASDISGANARLLFTPTYPNNTIKVARQAITV